MHLGWCVRSWARYGGRFRLSPLDSGDDPREDPMGAATRLAKRFRVGLRVFAAVLMVGMATVCALGVSLVVGDPAQATTLASCRNGTLASLLPELYAPAGIVVSVSRIFVTNAGAGTVGEYTTSGATVNAALVTGLDAPQGIAVSGSDIFVTNADASTVGEYSTSGATVNAALADGVSEP